MKPKPASGRGFEDKPFEATVTKVNTGNEILNTDSPAGSDVLPIPHPMLSANSWIRAVPEKGANLLLNAMGGGSLRRCSLGYISRSAQEYIRRYETGVGLYKKLNDGEWDLMTPKLGHIYGTADGKLFLRGGAIHSVLDGKKLHHKTRAVTHIRETHQHNNDTINEQERFGVVQRMIDNKLTWVKIPVSQPTTEKDSRGNTKTQAFAKEYSRMLGRDGRTLTAMQEGDCFDDEGKQLKHDSTNKKVRAYKEYYNNTGLVKWQWKLDEDGNELLNSLATLINLSANDAETSVDLKKLSLVLGDLCNLEAGTSMTLLAHTKARIGGNQQTVLGPDVSPIDSAIKGNMFMTTIMIPLLTALVTVFQGGSSSPLYPGFIPFMKAAAATLQPLISLLQATLSTNVKVSP